MKLSARADVLIQRPIDEVFDFATSCQDFPRFIHPFGPIPGIARAEMWASRGRGPAPSASST
jgi:hypothetical protein